MMIVMRLSNGEILIAERSREILFNAELGVGIGHGGVIVTLEIVSFICT